MHDAHDFVHTNRSMYNLTHALTLCKLIFSCNAAMALSADVFVVYVKNAHPLCEFVNLSFNITSSCI